MASITSASLEPRKSIHLRAWLEKRMDFGAILPLLIIALTTGLISKALSFTA